MEIAKKRGNNIAQEFVLPDYKTIKKGYVKGSGTEDDEHAQVVKMANDRFTVPEVLFNPSDIGINQAGIAEAITQTVSRCPEIFAEELYRNVIVSGGNSIIEGF